VSVIRNHVGFQAQRYLACKHFNLLKVVGAKAEKLQMG
jgi:hypothetical protein